MITPILLGQDDAAASGGWFGLSNIFWLTILVIFVLGIVAAFVRLLQKDKCLKLLEDYHVTYLAGGRQTIWGDLRVAGGGLVYEDKLIHLAAFNNDAPSPDGNRARYETRLRGGRYDRMRRRNRDS